MELPGDYGVSATFNVADLSPYLEDERLDSRTSPLPPGENDAAIRGNLQEDSRNLHGDLHGNKLDQAFLVHGEYLQHSKQVYLVSYSHLVVV